MSEHLQTVLTEIRSLLDEPAGAVLRPRAAVEKTLTDGYAHALTLDGERLRRVGRLRALVRAAERDETEIAAVHVEVAATDRELAEFRALLAALRAHAL